MKTTTKKALTFAAALVAAALGSPTPSQASDHVDGLKTAIDIGADLTDLFVFTSPADANKLVLIMNVHGFANSTSRFSNAVDYKFRIRPIDDAKTLVPSADPKKERSIVCNFSGGLPFVDANQTATCTFAFNDGVETVRFPTRADGFRAGGSGQTGTTRAFAGARSDPWFLDLARTLKFNASKPVDQSTAGSNGLHGTNVLSIVVEVDKRRLPGPLLAITAQSVRK